MSVIDINNIKEQIQTILQAANTLAADDYLSLNIDADHKVRGILKTHPAKILPQAHLFPNVTCYVDKKTTDLDTIMRSMNSGKRRATIDLKVVGTTWNDNMVTFDEDPSEDDCYNLMENIEQILRVNYTLNASVDWCKPTNIDYFDAILEEQTHLRSGVMNLEVTVQY